MAIVIEIGRRNFFFQIWFMRETSRQKDYTWAKTPGDDGHYTIPTIPRERW